MEPKSAGAGSEEPADAKSSEVAKESYTPPVPSAPTGDQITAPVEPKPNLGEQVVESTPPQPPAAAAKGAAARSSDQNPELPNKAKQLPKEVLERQRRLQAFREFFKPKQGIDRKSVAEILRPFLSRPDLPPLDETSIARLSRRLRDERLLVLQSEAFIVLRSAVQSIIQRAFCDASAQSLNLETAGELGNIPLRYILRGLATSERTSLLIAHAYEGSPEGFLDSLPLDYTETQQDLGSKNLWLVVLASPQMLRGRRVSGSTYVENVSWEEPVLRQYHPDHWKDYAAQIRQLRSQGRWAESWTETRSLAQQNELARLIAERSAGNWTRQAQQLTELADDEALENAIKFVACFFSEPGREEVLSPESFQRVLRAIIADQTLEQTVPDLAGQPGALKIVRTALTEIWQANSQRLIAKCGLHVTRDGGLPLVDFKDTGARSRVLEEFRTTHIWTFDNLAQRVQARRLIFDAHRPVRTGAIRLLLERMGADPAGFAKTCIPELTKGEPRPLPGPVRKGILELINTMIGTNSSEAALAGLAQLLESGDAEEAWLAGNRLRTVPRFQSSFVKLLRRVLDEAPAEIKTEAAAAITEWAGGDDPTAYPVVKEILQWHLSEPESPSREFALDLSLALLLQFLFPDDPDHIEESQAAVRSRELAPLLARMAFDPEMDLQLAKHPNSSLYGIEDLVIFWMLRLAGMKEWDPMLWVIEACFDRLQATRYERSQGERANLFRAMVMAEWLHGDGPHEEILLAAAKEITSAKERRKIRDDLQLLADAALASSSRMNVENWEGAEGRSTRQTLGKRLHGIREAARQAKARLNPAAAATSV